MKPQLAEVHTLYETNAREISEMLRQASENIASETDEHDRTKAIAAVKVTESGKIEIYGWGEIDDMAALALFQLGAAEITRIILDRDE